MRTAVVTGATGGIGSAIAHRPAKDGFTIITVDGGRTPADLMTTAGFLRSHRHRISDSRAGL